MQLANDPNAGAAVAVDGEEMVELPGWRICVQPLPTEMPKSSVMRFEISPEISSSLAGGTSPVFDQATVGSDISSATHGSSVASVAGKKRAPTKQWALASQTSSRTRTHDASEHLR